jgi:DNA-3-methyladenine glycosylase I
VKAVQAIRCKWCEDDPLLISYHDNEWGNLLTDDEALNDQTLFEFLTLELFQAGLSWRTILHKRENFRSAFSHFSINKVANFTSNDIERLLQDKGIIRNRRKIEATIHNANVCLDLISHHGSLSHFLDTLEESKEAKEKALKKTFKHVGITTAESFLYATGIVPPPHDKVCFLYTKDPVG